MATLPHLKEHLSLAHRSSSSAPDARVLKTRAIRQHPPLRRFVQRDKWRPSNELLELTREDLLEHPTNQNICSSWGVRGGGSPLLALDSVGLGKSNPTNSA